MSLDDAGGETPAQTRERLRDRFAPGAVRRMTQLGMLAGGALHEIGAVAPVVVYASSYGESCALESYLDSFPTPSPTLFQTSIHPSGVQQALIGSQQPVRELYPLSGDKFLAGQALAAAALAEAAGVVICGGEERGTYLLDHGVASDRAFGFALLLDRERSEASLGSVVIAPGGEATGLGLAAFFDLLKNRAPFDDGVAPGWRAKLAWR
ncbi:MAG: hypothetical protein ACREIA_11825 [Opitutaceae bacterium]